MGRQFTRDNILIIDDFPNMRSAVRRMLHELGEDKVDLAADGEEAIRMMRRTRYDIVLCDYNLGHGKDGQQLLEEVRELGLIDASAVFIIITAETARTYVLGALAHAPDDYVTKPFSKELLLFRLKKAHDRRRALGDIPDLIERGDLAAARDLCRERLAGNDRHALDILRHLCEVQLALGEHAQAVDTCEGVLARHNLPWARFGVARARHLGGDHHAAIELLRELLVTNTYFMEAYDWLARCYLAIEQSEEAQKMLMEAAQHCPKCLRLQRELGQLSLANGDLETAEKAFRTAIRSGEHSARKSAEEFTGLSNAQARQGKTHKALLTLHNGRRALAGKPDDLLQVLTGTATLYLEKNQPGDAAAVLREADALYRKHAEQLAPDASIGLAAAHIRSGNSEQGEAILASVLQNNHDDARCMDRVQQTLQALGVEQDVEALLEKTVGEMVQVNRRAIELTEKGELVEAIKLFEQAAAHAPRNRSFNLNAAQAMILHMQAKGAQPALLYKTRMHLDRVEAAGKSDERHRELTRLYRSLAG